MKRFCRHSTNLGIPQVLWRRDWSNPKSGRKGRQGVEPAESIPAQPGCGGCSSPATPSGQGWISRSLLWRTRQVTLCWLPVAVPTCSADQVKWLICLGAGSQALMALDTQPVLCSALQPFWGLLQVLPSWPSSGHRGWGTAPRNCARKCARKRASSCSHGLSGVVLSWRCSRAGLVTQPEGTEGLLSQRTTQSRHH